MDPSSRIRSLRSLAALGCLFGVAVAWSHVGPHPTPKPPPPVKAPPFSPGSHGRGDPVPNRFDTDTGLSSGGVGYAWTVDTVGHYHTTLLGIVGASSWSDPEAPVVGEGRTRASHWVALRLRSPSRVTIRHSAKTGVIDPLGLVPGETGGEDLRPAFTLYTGWQNAGPDETTYNSQGEIAWADALRYRAHAVDTGAGEAIASYELPAGLYSIALGGIGEAGFDPGRQGYEATLSILSRALPASVITSRSHYTTRRPTLRLRGRFRNPESAALLAVQQNRRTRFLPARGKAWNVAISGLKKNHGPTYVYLSAVSKDGRVSPRKRIILLRK